MVTFQDYDIETEIGRGTYSLVYQATHRKTAERVALKLYPERHLSDERKLQQFEARVQAIRGLNHAAMVPIYGHGIEPFGERPYIVMPLLENGSLQDRFDRDDRFEVSQIVPILSTIAEALDNWHGVGFLHTDLTPSSILFDAHNNAYLSGFELPVAADTGALTLLRDANLEPHYLAPEQVQRRDQTVQTDIYALTAILYEMMCGRPPYTGDTPLSIAYKHLNDPIPELIFAQEAPTYVAELNRLIARGMSKLSSERPETASALVAQFLEITGLTFSPEHSAEGVIPEPEEAISEPVSDDHSYRVDKDRGGFDPEDFSDQNKRAPWVILAVVGVAVMCMVAILGVGFGAVLIQRANPVATIPFPTIAADSGGTTEPTSSVEGAPAPTSSLVASTSALDGPLIPVRGAVNSDLFPGFAAADLAASEAGWHLYSNANAVRELVYHNGYAYVATGSGAVVIDLEQRAEFRLTPFDGLPGNDVTSVVVCDLPKPRIVFGTWGGLFIIDPAADPLAVSAVWNAGTSGLAADEVRSLACSPAGEPPALYVGHDDDGVSIYDVRQDLWRYVNRDDQGLRVDTAVDLAVSAEALWIAHSYALSRYDLESDQVIIYEEENGNLPDDSVRAVAIAPNGEVWLATIFGLIRGDGQGEWLLYDEQDAANIPGGVGEAVHVDSEGQVWFATSSGDLCHFDPAEERCAETYEFESDFANDQGVTSIETTADGRIFIGREVSGVQMAPIASPILELSWEDYLLEGQLSTNMMTAVAESGGYMWIGSERGLFRAPLHDLSGNDWIAYVGYDTPLPGTWVNALFADSWGGIWIGTSSGAAYISADQQLSTFLTDIDVNAFAQDSEQRIWVGTDEGIYIWNGADMTYFRGDLTFPSEEVSALEQFGTDMWIAYDTEALVRVTDGRETLYGNDDVGSYLFAMHDMVVIDDKLYVNNGRDVLVWDGTTFVESFSTDSIIEAFHYHEPSGTLMIATWKDGLILWDGEQQRVVGPEAGVPNRFVADVTVDSLGTIWIVGDSFEPAQGGGVARYVPDDR